MDYTYKNIWLINYPVMMSVLMEQLINITDAIFLGHVGETELGASAIAGLYYLILYMLGFGFSVGLQVMIARRNGERKYSDTGKTFFQGLWLLILLSFILYSLSGLFSPAIMQHLLHSEEVSGAVMAYLKWRIPGVLFVFPALAFRSFFVGTINTKMLTANAVIMVSSNIILNYLLIFGKGFFPALGIEGAAMASSISELISLVIYIWYAIFKTDKNKYGLTPVYDWAIQVRLLRISIWSMLHSFISVAPWFLFFISIEHLGKTQLAIANIIRSISSLFFVIVSSLAATTSSLVSNLIGEGKAEEMKVLCRKIIRLGYLIGIPLIMLATLFHENIIGIYTNNENLIQQAFWPFMVMLSNYLFALPSYVCMNAVSGTGATRKTFIFQVITIFFYILYLHLLNTLTHVPLAVYWTVEHLFVLLLLLFSMVSLRRTWNKNNKENAIL